MIETQAIIVGAGPAGAACAWSLRRQGIDCLILERETLPRTKLCAGWIQPEVLRALEMDVSDYPHTLTSFSALHVRARGLKLRIPTRQYAIRRREFDAWLVERAGVPVHTHHVRSIIHDGGHYVVDGTYRGAYLVGAGGTHCPVYRTLFSATAPRDAGALIVTQEEEFPYAHTDKRCILWFFENGLPGYAWYVPKADGYVNVGVGGSARQLEARGETIKEHWQHLVAKLETLGLVRGYGFTPRGHSYYLRGPLVPARTGNAYIVGDAAGLATRDLGEGIGPAVVSGLRAAVSIARGEAYTLEGIRAYSIRPAWLPRFAMAIARRLR